MADISLNKVTASDQASPTTPAIDSNVTQGQESHRRSSTSTPMLEVPQRPLPFQNVIKQDLYRSSVAINKLSSGDRTPAFQVGVFNENREELSFFPAQGYYDPSGISKLRIHEVDDVQYSKFYE